MPTNLKRKVGVISGMNRMRQARRRPGGRRRGLLKTLLFRQKKRAEALQTDDKPQGRGL